VFCHPEERRNTPEIPYSNSTIRVELLVCSFVPQDDKIVGTLSKFKTLTKFYANCFAILTFFKTTQNQKILAPDGDRIAVKKTLQNPINRILQMRLFIINRMLVNPIQLRFGIFSKYSISLFFSF